MIGPDSARITIVIPASVAERLKVQAEAQGRSISNLAARLIALAFEQDRRDG